MSSLAVVSPDPEAVPASPAKQPKKKRTAKQKKRLAWNIVLQVFAMIAIALLVYPDAASWIARIGHNAEISGYIDSVEQTPDAERQRILDAAYAYNDTLEPGSLTDPYISQNPDEARRTAVYKSYEELLRVSGTDVIGTLSYPRLDIGLPVYHGTSDEVISKGVGHLYGSSLPVGGPGTHSVMTSHSGLLNASLFTPLPKAKVGDTFHMTVLGETHYYEVISTEEVLPEQTESLRIEHGQDLVTLITCTPIGINSHRLLVTGTRVPGPDSDGRNMIAGDGITAGFPWWALIFLAGSGATGYLLFAPPRAKRGPDPEQGGAA